LRFMAVIKSANEVASSAIFLLAFRFLWMVNAETIAKTPEYCFRLDQGNPQYFKNESWQTTNLGELLQQMLQCYDSRVRVEHGGRGNPTEVHVSMYILSIGNFQVRDMDFQLSFYFRQQWRDARLAYKNHFHEEKITLGGAILKQLWLPQTYFVNKKGASASTDANFFVRIFPDGSVLVITKNTLTMDCYMDLRNFPFDVQKCNLTLESFGFTTKDVVYKWVSTDSSEAVEKDPGLTTSEFDIGPIRIFESTTMYKTGLFSGLKMELNFQRRSIYYLIQIYVPSAMIVVLSWISFWIDNQSIPARTALGITTVLAMTTLLFGVQSSLPSVPYIKAVDLFMIVSFAAVFVALVEFAVVNYTSMREKEQKESRATKNKYTVNPEVVMLNFRNLSYEGDGKGEHHMQNGVVHNGTVNDIENDNADVHKMEELHSNGTIGEHAPRDRKDSSRDLSHVFEPSRSNKCRWRCKVTANGIDAWSRILFPLAYGLFIVAYWIIYSANTEKSS
ncbi:glycine receptor subunit alpha-4-like, partial [Pocillopora damicornis]|uniref:glycine receptor subunit alpha-4-like n=1 Tax=Pocillopora damicornis TaxID=46731 RepID=UPI000F5564D3